MSMRVINSSDCPVPPGRLYRSKEGAKTVMSTPTAVDPCTTVSLTRPPAENNELVTSRVVLECSTGIGPVTEAQQRRSRPEPEQRKQWHNALVDLATE